MFNGNAFPSLSDIAAVTNNNEGIGGNNGWWILIILFALFGWGRGGYGYAEGMGGNNNYYAGGIGENYALATDVATLERKLDTVNNGLCDGFYAMNTGMLNGFSGVNMNMMQNTNALQASLTGVSNQLQQCCCDNRAATADLKYTMATDTCAITNAITQAAQNIMQNDNANFRQLHDENVAMQMAAKDDMIADLRAKLSRCDYRADNAEQTTYLINTLRPAPIPSFNVQNPYAYSERGCCQSSCCGQ